MIADTHGKQKGIASRRSESTMAHAPDKLDAWCRLFKTGDLSYYAAFAG